MKRIFSLILAFALLMCLIGCGQVDTAAVDEELFGIWRYYNVMPEGTFDSAYIFVNGEVACMANVSGFEQTTTGTYTIEKKEIKISYENGIEAELDYTFEDGELRLFSDGVELEKING